MDEASVKPVFLNSTVKTVLLFASCCAFTFLNTGCQIRLFWARLLPSVFVTRIERFVRLQFPPIILSTHYPLSSRKV